MRYWLLLGPNDTDRWAWPLRAIMAGALGVTVVLVAAVIEQYPQAVSGSGTPIYATMLSLVLAGYAVATVLLTRVDLLAVRWAMPAGLVAAVLWTLGMPVGGAYRLSMPWLDLFYAVGLVVAFTAAPVVAAAMVARRTGAVERVVLTGAATGMYAALANLIGGLILVLVLPGRVPLDPSVLNHYHTPTDILGASVGEDLVPYVLLLLGWPLVGTFLGIIGNAIGMMLPRPEAL